MTTSSSILQRSRQVVLRSHEQLTLPKIVQMYSGDFGKTKQEIIQSLQPFLPASVGELKDNLTIVYDNFNWDFQFSAISVPLTPSISTGADIPKEKPREDRGETSSPGGSIPDFRPIIRKIQDNFFEAHMKRVAAGKLSSFKFLLTCKHSWFLQDQVDDSDD